MKAGFPERVRAANDGAENPQGDYVLYWMIASRRARYNFALEHAALRAQDLGLPLVVFEPLRIGYRWASARFHHFVMDGMLENARAFARAPVTYFPYVEREPGEATGLLAAFATRAALVVSDDAPSFFYPRMLAAAAGQLKVRLDLVDSNGLYPMHATERVFTTAASFRRHLQKEIAPYLAQFPRKNPLARRRLTPLKAIPTAVARRWSATSNAELEDRGWLSSLAIDHGVGVCAPRGGSRAAARALRAFLDGSFEHYATSRNHPNDDCQSHLAPYLHFGHISSHDVFLSITAREGWTPGRIADRATGSRQGWWGATEAAEAFIDQLVTWREIGCNAAAHQPGYTRYDSLPGWALETLGKHARDKRAVRYSNEALEGAETHDPIWNAAQIQLRREGTIHNYLRMLWGKKILEWTSSPEAALELMIELNNKYALDGRDPNSYSGIFWVLGRYDRAWGPERPIFGKVRYMSSDSTRRKLKLGDYLERYSEAR